MNTSFKKDSGFINSNSFCICKAVDGSWTGVVGLVSKGLFSMSKIRFAKCCGPKEFPTISIKCAFI